jgi:hypothetical protein
MTLSYAGTDGTIRATISGNDRGVVFTGIRGYEIFPAVAFYSSGRTISLLLVEGPRLMPGSTTVNISSGDTIAAASTVVLGRGGGGGVSAVGSGGGDSNDQGLSRPHPPSVGYTNCPIGRRSVLRLSDMADALVASSVAAGATLGLGGALGHAGISAGAKEDAQQGKDKQAKPKQVKLGGVTHVSRIE